MNDCELKELVTMSMMSSKENDFIAYISESPLDRANKRLDKISREFLKLIKQKY